MVCLYFANAINQYLSEAISFLSRTNKLSGLSMYVVLTLLLLNTTCPVLANSVDPDQLASEEAN